MAQTLTPNELSELTHLLLQEVGKLDLYRQQGNLTPYGEQRIEALSTLYHKLTAIEAGVKGATIYRADEPTGPTGGDDFVVDPHRAAFIARLQEVYQTHTMRSLSDVNADFVYDVLHFRKVESPKVDAMKYLRNYTNIGLREAKAIIEAVQQ